MNKRIVNSLDRHQEARINIPERLFLFTADDVQQDIQKEFDSACKRFITAFERVLEEVKEHYERCGVPYESFLSDNHDPLLSVDYYLFKDED